MAETRERDIEGYFTKEVAKLGGKAYKWQSMSNRAVPDRIVLLPFGIKKLVELKAPGKQPTPLQKKVHENMKAMGHAVAVIDTKAMVDYWIERWRKQINNIKERMAV